MFGNKRYLKNKRGKNNGFSYSGNKVSFGEYGLKSISWGLVNSFQLESGRKVISRIIKKVGKFWIRIFPDRSYTKKPIDVRMGNGKGDVSYYFFYVKPGNIIYEISGLSKILSFKILKLSSYKLPVKTIIVSS